MDFGRRKSIKKEIQTEIESHIFEERIKKKRMSLLQSEQQVENFVIENLSMLQMMKSNIDQSTVNRQSMNSKATSSAQLITDQKKTNISTILQNKLFVIN